MFKQHKSTSSDLIVCNYTIITPASIGINMDFGGSQCAYNGDYTTANKRKRTDINNINGDKNLSAPNSTKEAQKKQSK